MPNLSNFSGCSTQYSRAEQSRAEQVGTAAVQCVAVQYSAVQCSAACCYRRVLLQQAGCFVAAIKTNTASQVNNEVQQALLT